ncbi:hypothetical protein ABH944_004919 [Caballeronia udeis]|jgi:hypothetical protein|uniref:Uncharacterized protein n=1 Tax=Caballeronia udeis TaxID=1232866 RepID=A0ABW8MLL8_9BURK
MPRLPALKQNKNSPLIIGPMPQLIELRQSSDLKIGLGRRAPQSTIRRLSVYSSDNITNNLQALLDGNLMGFSDRLHAKTGLLRKSRCI